MRVMHCVPDVPAHSFPAKKINQFTEIVDNGAGDKEGKQYVEMLADRIRLPHLVHYLSFKFSNMLIEDPDIILCLHFEV